jgi:hypothetical protein
MITTPNDIVKSYLNLATGEAGKSALAKRKLQLSICKRVFRKSTETADFKREDFAGGTADGAVKKAHDLTICSSPLAP